MKYINGWFIFFVIFLCYCFYAKFKGIECTKEWFIAMAFLGMFKLECIEEDLKTIKKGHEK